MVSTSRVDVNVPRFNQAVVGGITAAAFVLQQEWLVAVGFLLLGLSYVGGPRFAPLTHLYVRVVRPRFQPGGPTEFESAAPPRFAQLLGTIFLGGAILAFALGVPVLAWVLTLIVMALATLAATTRICVGCIIYEKTFGVPPTPEAGGQA
ncbi:MAG: DUF4395 domain-containing protein [Acidimicrobiia bacterium]